MLLWTIIDKKIYLERNPHDLTDSHCDYYIDTWYNNIKMLIDERRFPKRL